MSIMTLYDLKAEDAEKAACDLFDMTMGIIQEYRNGAQPMTAQIAAGRLVATRR